MNRMRGGTCGLRPLVGAAAFLVGCLALADAAGAAEKAAGMPSFMLPNLAAAAMCLVTVVVACTRFRKT